MEDLSISLLQNFTPDEDNMHFDIRYPDMALATDVVVFFKGCDLSCTVTVGKTQVELDLEYGPNRIPIDFRDDRLVLDLNIDTDTEDEESPFIPQLSITFLDMNPVPINTEDIHFINKPESGFAMGIDFEYALTTAQGFDECVDKEAQIISPQGETMTIRESSGNFLWRKDVLCCRLPVAIQYRVRLRYESSYGWGEWSDWNDFVCKRKMTL